MGGIPENERGSSRGPQGSEREKKIKTEKRRESTVDTNEDIGEDETEKGGK